MGQQTAKMHRRSRVIPRLGGELRGGPEGGGLWLLAKTADEMKRKRVQPYEMRCPSLSNKGCMLRAGMDKSKQVEHK